MREILAFALMLVVIILSSEHHCGAGILVLNLTVLNVKKHVTGRCCGLTAVLVALSDKPNLATVIQLDCLL